MPKFGNHKTVVDGMTFDSKKEARRYCELRMLERGKRITGLALQPRFDFVINGVKIGYYKADFSYVENGACVVEDVKSEFTKKLPVYRLKRKLMQAVHGIEIKEV